MPTKSMATGITTKGFFLEDTRMKTFGKTLAGIGAALFTMLVAASAFALTNPTSAIITRTLTPAAIR